MAIVFVCLSTEEKENLEHACSSLHKTTSMETADVSELPTDAVKTFKGMSDLLVLCIAGLWFDDDIHASSLGASSNIFILVRELKHARF